MKRRTLGRTGLEVSEVGLGTVELGLRYVLPGSSEEAVNRREAERILWGALDGGVNFMDTARAYGGSESLIGEIIGSRRGELVLASKIAGDAATAQDVAASIEASLRALRTGTIDLMYLHNSSVEVLRSGWAAEALERARQAGKIRFLGASTYGAAEANAALEDGRFDCLQIAWNALDRWPEQELLARASDARIGLVIRSVFLRGALTPRYRELPASLGGLRAASSRIEEAARSAGVSMPELALRYVLSDARISSALVGASSLEDIDDARRAAGAGALPAGMLEAIRKMETGDPGQLDPRTWPTA